MIGPRAQLAPQPGRPIPDQGSQEMARDSDGARTQRERTHDVQRSAHPPGCEHRQAGGFVPPQRIQQTQHRRLPPPGQVRVVPAGTPLVLDGDEIGAARPRHVDGRDPCPLQHRHRVAGKTEPHLLGDDGNGHRRDDGRDPLGPVAKIPVPLGHDQFLRHVEVDLQGIGLEHLDGTHRTLRRCRRPHIGQHEGLRGLAADDAETIGAPGVPQGDVLRTAGDRHTRVGGGPGQACVDLRRGPGAPGHRIDVERGLPAGTEHGRARIGRIDGGAGQGVVDEGDVVEGVLPVPVVQANGQVQVFVLPGRVSRGAAIGDHGVTSGWKWTDRSRGWMPAFSQAAHMAAVSVSGGHRAMPQSPPPAPELLATAPCSWAISASLRS